MPLGLKNRASPGVLFQPLRSNKTVCCTAEAAALNITLGNYILDEAYTIYMMHGPT